MSLSDSHVNQRPIRRSVEVAEAAKNKVEALAYEKEVRLRILNNIKSAHIDVSPEVADLYYHDYVLFSLQTEKALSDLVIRSGGTNRCFDVMLDYDTNILSWKEWRAANEKTS